MRQYTKEFRDSTVELVLNSDKSAMQIAKDLDINDKTLYSWIRAYKKANSIPIQIKKETTSKESLEDENKRLKKELAVLKQEREIFLCLHSL
ncbi:MAG: transposase [Alphaproteobacteria bacterium]|nr:transposase [Alphaproteobacteria bacterium]